MSVIGNLFGYDKRLRYWYWSKQLLTHADFQFVNSRWNIAENEQCPDALYNSKFVMHILYDFFFFLNIIIDREKTSHNWCEIHPDDDANYQRYRERMDCFFLFIVVL